MVSTTPNRRALQREAQTAAIKVVARRLIADKGVAQLSLREVAREMGLVSSALYRYFATRDELLTALIFDAYNELGAAVERAEARVARADCHGRWRAACAAVRRGERISYLPSLPLLPPIFYVFIHLFAHFYQHKMECYAIHLGL